MSTPNAIPRIPAGLTELDPSAQAVVLGGWNPAVRLIEVLVQDFVSHYRCFERGFLAALRG